MSAQELRAAARLSNKIELLLALDILKCRYVCITMLCDYATSTTSWLNIRTPCTPAGGQLFTSYIISLEVSLGEYVSVFNIDADILTQRSSSLMGTNTIKEDLNK